MTRLTYPDIARIFGTGLIATGVGLLLFVAITVVWGDPFTKLSEAGAQDRLSAQLGEVLTEGEELTDTGGDLDPELTRRAAAAALKSTPLGRSAGRISIPKIGVRKIIVHGARDEDLTKGPGLYKETRFPGSGSPIAIAGHRTTYGAPFLHVDQLKPGNSIIVSMPYGRFTYKVTRTEIIAPNDWSILEYGAAEPTRAARLAVKRTRQCMGTCEHLVLTACHPKYSAAKRIAVFARLDKVQLAGAAA
ncbi:MAG: class E sortase [Gaiellales bacterium]